MKFFFADSQDTVDPSFDFDAETRSELRVRQRDDLYPHEVHPVPVYDGILLSKAMVDGNGRAGSRYSLAQRHRLLRQGVRGFFRLDNRPIATMGDCGAFSYVREEYPPVTVDEVITFYEQCGFDYGLSVDHVILGYRPELDQQFPTMDLVPGDWRKRQEITLELASEFWRLAGRSACRLTPLGVAQGWSPGSYARSVVALQDMGYRYIALGGMVPLKSADILRCLETISPVSRPDTRLHLLGIARWRLIARFSEFGVASFDSTSPLRQAFMDDRDNYYTPTRNYLAVRVPQVEGNFQLQRRIVAGELKQETVRELEKRALQALRGYAAGDTSLNTVLEEVLAYEQVHHPGSNQASAYGEVLEDQPWKNCECEVCRRIGINVIMFRGTERNKRRGFHNLYVAYRRLQRDMKSRELMSPSYD